MSRGTWLRAVLLLSLPGPVLSQSAAWVDPVAHHVQFVAVEKNVKLEVLDWGGHSTPIILLAGGGDTAHVFDDFAAKLAASYRANPPSLGAWVSQNSDPRVQSAARTYSTALMALTEKQEDAVRNGVPVARVITVPDGNHYVYLSNEEAALRDVRVFVSSLP